MCFLHHFQSDMIWDHWAILQNTGITITTYYMNTVCNAHLTSPQQEGSCREKTILHWHPLTWFTRILAAARFERVFLEQETRETLIIRCESEMITLNLVFNLLKGTVNFKCFLYRNWSATIGTLRAKNCWGGQGSEWGAHCSLHPRASPLGICSIMVGS